MNELFASLGSCSDFNCARDDCKRAVLEISRRKGLVRHLEIGGVRDPLFLPEEAEAHGLSLTPNDISAQELSRAPEGYATPHAGADAPAILGEGCYALAYSRMVMEHVPDVARMWRNIAGALSPGGVALNFFQTLCAPPYVINRMIPESLSRFLAKTIFADRANNGVVRRRGWGAVSSFAYVVAVK